MVDYQLVYESKSHYLHVSVSGELDVHSDQKIDTEIRKECERLNLRYALIDISACNSRLTPLQNHEAAKTFRSRLGNLVKAVAIVDTIDNLDRSEMYELTATNRGAHLRFFTDTGDAEEWLIEYGKQYAT